MAPKASNLILVLSLALLSTTTTISAFNITRLLDNHKEFSTFNDILTKTGVAAAIDARRTITVLVVDNSGMEALSGKPLSTARSIIATHVILDYFDSTKLGDLEKKTAKLTTLYQASGTADKDQGFLNVTTDGEVVFGSAVKGAPHNAKMVKSVAAQPYNISVIQISQPIETPGLDQTAPVSPSTSPKAAPPTPVAAPPPKADAPTTAPTPAADAPADDDAADGPSDGPSGSSPGPSPVPAPGPGDADADDEPDAKVVSPPKSGGVRVSVGGALVMGLVALAL